MKSEEPKLHSTFVVDPSMYRVGDYDSLASTYSKLSEVVRTDLRYHYTGPICARRWQALCEHAEYGHQELVGLVDEVAPGLIRRLKKLGEGRRLLNLISLGPGDGEIDTRLLQHLENEFEINCYHCVDTSFELLRSAVNRVSRAGLRHSDLHIRAVCGDFTKMRKLLFPTQAQKMVNLYCLTGFTLGNYNEELLLSGVAQGLSQSDFLFLDARLHSLQNWNGERSLTSEEKIRLVRSYANKSVNQFVFGPVEVATTATESNVSFGYDVDSKGTCVPNALVVTIYCQNLRTTMRLTGEPVECDRLDLACTKLYCYESLLSYFPTINFKPVWHINLGSVAFFLLSKDSS